MQKCPGCQATLPPSAYACHFCGAQFGQAPPPPRSLAAPVRVGGRNEAPRWIWIAYFVVSAWWALNGVLGILQGVGVLEGGYPPISLTIGAFSLVVGLGLLARMEWARGVVNVLAFIQIVFGTIDLVLIFFSGIGGLWGIVWLFQTFLEIGLAGLMIYVIGETDTRPPSF
jgi:hypothetical protein